MAITTTPTEPQADESTVTISVTALTASTAYLIAIGQPGSIGAATTGVWDALTSGNANVKSVTSDGGGNATATFVPNAAGTYTVNVYLAPVATVQQTTTFTAVSAG